MGQKTVKGYMKSIGITASEKRIGRALSVMSPMYQAKRNSNTVRQTNPVPYTMLNILVTSYTKIRMRNWECMA